MNVVQVPRRFVRHEWGGTETVVLETSRRLIAKGHRTHVASTVALADRLDDDIDGVPVRRFPYFYPYLRLSATARRRLDQKGGNVFSWSLLAHLAAVPDLDLIHLHTGKRLGGIARLVARQRRVPYIVSLHGGLLDVPHEEAATWTEPTVGAVEWGKVLGAAVGARRVIDDAAAVICLGDDEATRVQFRHPGKRVLQLPNGVDTVRFAVGDGEAFRKAHGIPSTRQMILTVGRIDPQKNQRLSVDVLDALLQRRRDAHLVLLGHVTNDAYAEALREHVRARGLQSRVTIVPGLAPGTRGLVDAYHAADLFLLPSVHEPFGIVVLEAWAACCPVLAARVGGIPSFVSHGRTGLLFRRHDAHDVAVMAEALLASPVARRTLVEAASLAVRAYDWDRVTDRLIRLYEEVLSAHPVR